MTQGVPYSLYTTACCCHVTVTWLYIALQWSSNRELVLGRGWQWAPLPPPFPPLPPGRGKSCAMWLSCDHSGYSGWCKTSSPGQVPNAWVPPLWLAPPTDHTHFSDWVPASRHSHIILYHFIWFFSLFVLPSADTWHPSPHWWTQVINMFYGIIINEQLMIRSAGHKWMWVYLYIIDFLKIRVTLIESEWH